MTMAKQVAKKQPKAKEPPNVEKATSNVWVGRTPEIVTQLRDFRSLMLDAARHGSHSYPLEAHSRLQNVLDVVYSEAKNGNMYACALYIKTMFDATARLQEKGDVNAPAVKLIFNNASQQPLTSESEATGFD